MICIENILELKCKKMTNKYSRGITLTKVLEAFVPMEYNTRIIGHQHPKSYSK